MKTLLQTGGYRPGWPVRFLCFLLLLLAGTLPAMAQNGNAVPFWSNDLGRIAYTPETPGWYRFKPNTVDSVAGFFVRYKTAFGLGPDDEMKLVQSVKDKIGMVHHRFQQYYKGVRIEGAEYLLHEKDGFATSANGKMVYNLKKTERPVLGESAARAKALQAVPSAQYRSAPETSELVGANAYQPRSELVYQKKNVDLPFIPENFRLCYHYTVYKANGDGYSVYVDAQTGEVVNRIPLQSECTAATATTNWYGARTIFTTQVPFTNLFWLQDNCTNSVIAVRNANNSTNATGDIYVGFNTTWGNTNDLRSASTSLWATRRSVDFFQNVMSRNGYDGLGGDVSVYQNAGFTDANGNVYFSNASMTFSGGRMRIGNNGTASNTDDWNTLDIVGHEFTHAVTGSSSKLTYQGESGALNESFSDIFGTYIEWWDGGSTFDWLVGEDRGSTLRSMSNPNSFSDPDTYKGTSWFTGTGDNGGVHVNSGVQNFWFYLLASGGAGTNDNGKAYNVSGIGMPAAGFIAYVTDAFYLTASSQYIDARNQSIQVAIDYYGACSRAALQTANAWYAVGVGGAQSVALHRNVCGSYTSTLFSYHFKGVDILPVSANCNVTLNAGPNAYLFSASKSIVFYPGFRAVAGSKVNAFIDPCNLTLNSAVAAASEVAPQQDARSSPVMMEPPLAKAPDGDAGLSVYPNPARDQVNLVFTLPKETRAVVLELYAMDGQRLRSTYLGTLAAGRHVVPVSVRSFSSGMYHAWIRGSAVPLRTRFVVAR